MHVKRLPLLLCPPLLASTLTFAPVTTPQAIAAPNSPVVASASTALGPQLEPSPPPRKKKHPKKSTPEQTERTITLLECVTTPIGGGGTTRKVIEVAGGLAEIIIFHGTGTTTKGKRHPKHPLKVTGTFTLDGKVSPLDVWGVWIPGYSCYKILADIPGFGTPKKHTKHPLKEGSRCKGPNPGQVGVIRNGKCYLGTAS